MEVWLVQKYNLGYKKVESSIWAKEEAALQEIMLLIDEILYDIEPQSNEEENFLSKIKKYIYDGKYRELLEAWNTFQDYMVSTWSNYNSNYFSLESKQIK